MSYLKLISSLAINKIQQRLICKKALYILTEQLDSPLFLSGGNAYRVRGDEHIGKPPQRVICWQRLYIRYIKSCG
jgi:hypothetical protein